MTPIATATNRADPPITVESAIGNYSQVIAITPDGTAAYVANSDSDTVTPIATATNAPIRQGHHWLGRAWPADVPWRLAAPHRTRRPAAGLADAPIYGRPKAHG